MSVCFSKFIIDFDIPHNSKLKKLKIKEITKKKNKKLSRTYYFFFYYIFLEKTFKTFCLLLKKYIIYSNNLELYYIKNFLKILQISRKRSIIIYCINILHYLEKFTPFLLDPKLALI